LRGRRAAIICRRAAAASPPPSLGKPVSARWRKPCQHGREPPSWAPTAGAARSGPRQGSWDITTGLRAHAPTSCLHRGDLVGARPGGHSAVYVSPPAPACAAELGLSLAPCPAVAVSSRQAGSPAFAARTARRASSRVDSAASPRAPQHSTLPSSSAAGRTPRTCSWACRAGQLPAAPPDPPFVSGPTTIADAQDVATLLPDSGPPTVLGLRPAASATTLGSGGRRMNPPARECGPPPLMPLREFVPRRRRLTGALKCRRTHLPTYGRLSGADVAPLHERRPGATGATGPPTRSYPRAEASRACVSIRPRRTGPVSASTDARSGSDAWTAARAGTSRASVPRCPARARRSASW